MKMKPIVSLIIFHSVFGKNSLVEVENGPTKNELSSDEKFEAELNNLLGKPLWSGKSQCSKMFWEQKRKK